MNSNGSSSLAELEAERDRLRLECSTLFDNKRAIEIQMGEIQQRLQWLDDKIDGTGVVGGGEEGLLAGCGKRNFDATQTQHDHQSGTTVKFEAIPEKNGNGKRRSRGRISIALTQPEEFLTDPHTQLEEHLTDPSQELANDSYNNNNDDVAAPSSGQARRISTSPPSEMFASTTPPGLKPSVQTTPMDPAGHSAEVRGATNSAKSVNPYAKPTTNPFQDLWTSNETTNQLNTHSSSKGRKSVGTNGANTLDKYLFPTQPNKSSASLTSNADCHNEVNASSQSDRMAYHLHNTFNIAQFRGHQEEIINATMRNQDAFVVMRTGGGKSLTYQLPAVLESESRQRKVTVVVSPLISLIRDQEEQMNQMRSGSALSFTSGLKGGTSEHARRWGLVRDPNAGVALIFVTPEKVGKSNKFMGEMEKLQNQGRLGRFVVDECHCATQWGHDFRPDYTKLGLLKHHFPSIPLLAVTATASERVREDCAKILRLGTNYQFFRSTANRPNLNYSVRCKPDSKEGVVKGMAAFIKENHAREAGIIYTFSRKEADDVAGRLCDAGIVARSYHSSVEDTRKDQIQRSWMRNQTQVVVATIAFGLGINKPDVRFVLHHSLSKSLEAYYQESGRAGRDGKPANCVLFYSPKDVPRMLGMIHGEAGEPNFWAMARYGQAHGDDAVCRHVILAVLGEVDDTMGMTLIDLQKKCTTTTRQQVGAHCQTVAKVVNALNTAGDDCTINQIVTRWRSKTTDSNFGFLKDNPPKDLSKEGEFLWSSYIYLSDTLIQMRAFISPLKSARESLYIFCYKMFFTQR